jgi:hypothetical protein
MLSGTSVLDEPNIVLALAVSWNAANSKRLAYGRFGFVGSRDGCIAERCCCNPGDRGLGGAEGGGIGSKVTGVEEEDVECPVCDPYGGTDGEDDGFGIRVDGGAERVVIGE